MFDDDLQSIVARAGWDGSIPSSSGDRIVLVDSNIGWSKVDRNIARTLDYEVTLNEAGPSTAKITVGYINRSRPDGTGCESQGLNLRASYDELKNTCYWNLIRIYTAEGGSLISSDRLPLPANSVYEAQGLGAAGDDTVSLGFGPGGSFISGLLVIPPGDERYASFTVLLPASVVVWDGEMATYSLDLAAQPGSQGRETTIWVELPGGYAYTGGSMRPTSIDGNRIRFDLPLTEDMTLSVDMRRSTAPSAALPVSPVSPVL
jgi:hypothetical protein